MCGGNGHPESGEAARADPDEYFVGAAVCRRRHHLGDHRHQPLRVAAADDVVSSADDSAGGIEQSGRAGGARRVEGEDHKRHDGHMRPNAATPLQAQTASTLSTSGT